MSLMDVGEAVAERFVEFEQARGRKYPAIVKLWNSAWAEFVPFLDFDVEIRRVVCTTNAIESINARIRRAVRARGHFPNASTPLANLHSGRRVASGCVPCGRTLLV